jgi:hypothetical protein
MSSAENRLWQAASVDQNGVFGDRVETHTSKADFDAIYRDPDPRRYFSELSHFEYQVPQQALPVIESVLAESTRIAQRSQVVLDLCCSYGINAALLRGDVDLNALTHRYIDAALISMSSDELIVADRAFHSARIRRPDLTVLGIDVSKPAIEYGLRTGLLADGWSENLEVSEPTEALAAGVREVDVIICTGGVGYISEQSFRRVLGAVARPRQLVIVVFVLRVFSYEAIEATLAEYGLVTERLPGTFLQRRFVNQTESDAAVRDVRRRGLDPSGKESAGYFHAECWISRPAADVKGEQAVRRSCL